MSALEQMRPFFRFCQFVGFFPFRMEINRQTGKFQQFSFSWRNSVTLWYLTLTFSQFIAFGTMLSTALPNTTLKSINLPITVTMSVAGSALIYCLLILSARFWITVYFTALRQAIQQMQIVEQSLREQHPIPDCRCTIKIRIFIGLILSIVWVGVL